MVAPEPYGQQSEWTVPEVGRAAYDPIIGGVRMQDIGYDLAVTPTEARHYAQALMAAADAAESIHSWRAV